MIKGSSVRKSDYPIHPLFLDRWSPRALSGEKISETELFTIIEAARWAPSAFNEQPWRFVYAMRETKEWEVLYSLLDDFNKSWTKNASALICLIASKNFAHNSKPNRNHMSDSGSAWENLALQANLQGLIAHGMARYDLERAMKELAIPENYEIVHMIAVGKPGDMNGLPEKIQQGEKPNDRKPLNELVFKGRFGA